MSNTSEDAGEGSSPAAWIAVVIMLVGVFIGTLALFLNVLPAVYVGAVIVPIGLIVGAVLSRLGFGTHGTRGGDRAVQGAAVLTATATTEGSLLDALMAGAAEDAAERRRTLDLASVERDALAAVPARDASAALARGPRVHVIAEVKRRSPSRGDLAAIPDPAGLAAVYERGGAAVISVLTEGRRFGGSLADLVAVRAAVDLPLLRKDFVSTEYQVLEARAAGADLVLLIVAGLDDATLERLHRVVTDTGMTALVEAHDADEVDRALAVGARVIGVNARDLRTFTLDPSLFGRLADRIPDSVIRVAESAVRTADDVARYRRDGADAVLVGEALVTGDPAHTLRQFLQVGSTMIDEARA